ncbi:hypothetical protein M0802_003866 [Mischocyttarus mexicanus]|nr:hypothetical protein M0802_003866 [Mischocyttarus mexicanus]
MITIIILILFSTFITVTIISPAFANSSSCQCSLTNLDDMKLFYDDNMDLEIILNVQSWDNMEVTCKSTEELEDFKYSSKSPGKTMNSLSISSCVLSDITSLKNFVKKLGIVETKTFRLQTFQKNNTLLTREHLNGISNVKELVLSYNNLFNVSSDLFEDFPQLEKLDLSHNRLTLLPRNIFDATLNLTHIDLGKNDIITVNLRLFYSLQYVQHLDLGDNRLRYIQEDTFTLLETLKSLSLRANKLNKIPGRLFRQLKQLETIDISHNSFLDIEQHTFYTNKDLRQIMFHNNNISLVTLPEYIFSNLRKLEEIYLNNNGFKHLSESLFWNSPLLKYIHLENNLIAYLRESTFKGLKSLTELNMENNRLRYIEQEALLSLKNLRIAKFSNNQLRLGKGSRELSPFSNNHFQELHLSNNSIRKFFPDWSSSNNLTFLNLSHNIIRIVSDSAIYHTKKRDVVILIDHNPMFCDCHMYDLVRYYRDEMPEYVKNYVEINPGELVCIQPAGTIGPKVKEFNTTNYICTEFEYFGQGSSCPYGCICTVRPKDKTRILDCSNLNMSEFVIDEKRFQFVNNYSLILNLTGNALTRIPSIETLESYNVTNLLLSNNFISKITVDQLPKNLTVLQLHNNDMESIDSDVIKHFNSSFFTDLTLSGNPIICDCDVEDLFFFVKLKGFSFKDLRKLKCKNMNIPMYYISFDNICSPVLGLKEEEVLNEGETSVHSKRYGKTIDSLLIRSCVLSNTTSLDKFVKKLGIVESHTFSFQSFKTNNTLLTREHLKGISNVKELILSYNNLSNISIDFFVDFSELEKLDLSHNNLTQLNDIFNATPHLKYLDLNKNNIYSMSPTLFYKLEELEHLDLGYNRLRNIHGSTFNKQESLKSLSLKANGMTDVSLELFSELKNLKTIDISYNNFVSIPQDLFLKNKHLRRILFHNNTIDLKTVPDYIFANLEKLEEVNLNKVGILYLPDSLFYYSPSLKYFYFENNLLISLRHTYFRALKNLEVLKLNNNLIREIPERIFTDLGKLKILDLSMNNIYNITRHVINQFIEELFVLDFFLQI